MEIFVGNNRMIENMGSFHGDEDEIEYEARAQREAYEDEHADDWEHED